MEKIENDIKSKIFDLGSQANLFLVSYTALSLIFAVRTWPNKFSFLAFALAGAWGIFSAWQMMRTARKRPKIRAKVEMMEDQGGAVAGYLATYLLPFLGGMPSKWNDWVAYAIYFIVAFVIFSKSNLGLINPTLYALGWRVYSAKIKGEKFILISPHELRGDATVSGSRLRGRVLVIEKNKEQTDGE
ncbi:hypothetical protein [Nocardiopsis dassonvillei]|uniref:hypothetical protein n=1 Tax=Nocardiopsis dassonvillei TaxID=2014 RepID=UPI003F55EFA0